MLDSHGRLGDSPNNKINLVLRSPVSQSDNCRGIDDLKRGVVNIAIDSPLVLPSWGHIVEMILSTDAKIRDWDLVTGDRDADYKNAPIPPEHARFCMIDVVGHFDSLRCAFALKNAHFWTNRIGATL